MTFAIGDLVADKENLKAWTSFAALRVVGTLDDAVLCEYYGDGYDGEVSKMSWVIDRSSSQWREGIVRFMPQDLCTMAQAFQMVRDLENAKDNLEKQFEKVRGLLQGKLDQAAALVSEVATIAQDHGKDFFELKRECMPLYQALDGGGWSHSHMQC